MLASVAARTTGDAAAQRVFLALRGVTVIIWSSYPLVRGVTLAGLLDPLYEEAGFAVLDVFAKV